MEKETIKKELTEEMDVELPCLGQCCKEGEGSGTWKSPFSLIDQALEKIRLQIDGEASIQDEDSQVPEVITPVVDQGESVISTTEHQPVQKQDPYPSVLARNADQEKSVTSTAEHQRVQRQGFYPSVPWVSEKKADLSTYQELYPASTINLIASEDSETRHCSSPQIEREATTVSDQRTVSSYVQEHQNEEGQGEERDKHVPNPSSSLE